MTRSLAKTFKDYISSANCTKVAAKAHADIPKGGVVELTLDGVTAAPANSDRAGFFGVALEAVNDGEMGVFAIDGFVQVLSGAEITYGLLLDPSANFKVKVLSDQTDGNGFARAIELASGADKLIWAKIL